MKKIYPFEVLLWSIAFPGFGQIINKMYIRGAFFILLEFVINVKSSLNMNILYSFQGKANEAVLVTNYEWAMFYPCVYMFAIYESFLRAIEKSGQNPPVFLTLPFVTGAYFSTVGVIYSNTIPYRFWIPPTFIPILGIAVGVAVGFFVRFILIRFSK
ncbi:hypothetical protein [Guptibacillus hwajinpoensis]|uniref:Uncharacterized protein n=1 Tax=Guptibacillus hwajinpoensis TaxID=208199 RepID=A0A0J6CVP3_9BACL|nr:hypothetical protein [Alkalihalobacillus macyae]KMM36139.1 hypothetical protein AB986_18580 [Alkalihalobacillus macyae]